MSMRLSAAKWADLVAAWESSGRSARAFADERGIAESSLRWWKSELARRARQEPPRRSPGPRLPGERSVALARVVRDGEPPPVALSSSLVVIVGSARIVVERDFDPSHLRAVVRVLGDAT